MSDDNLPRFPAWRQAVSDFLAEFMPGDMVPHDWLLQHFGMPELTPGQLLSSKDHAARQFAWLSSVEQFKQELLQDHAVLLWAVRGEGYRWVPPHEQTRTAMDALVRDIRKVFSAGGQRLQRLRLDALDDTQRKEHTDATAKLAGLRQMARRALK